MLQVLSFFRFSWYLHGSGNVFDVLANGLNIFTSKKHRVKRCPHIPFALMSKRASFSLVVDLVSKLSSSNGWRRGSISEWWPTSSMSFAMVSLLLLWRKCVYPPLRQCGAWAIVKSWPHGQIFWAQFRMSSVIRLEILTCSGLSHILIVAGHSANFMCPFLKLGLNFGVSLRWTYLKVCLFRLSGCGLFSV